MKEHRKWTYELAMAEAKKYSTRTQFQNMAGGCYMYALKNGILDDICADMIVHKKRWTQEKCIAAAKKYEYYSDFRKNENDAYLISLRRGWINKIKSILKESSQKNILKKSKWNNKENTFKEARKYKTKNEFREKSRSAYEACYRNGWVTEACGHMSTPKKEKRVWSKEECLAEIKKYENKVDFRKKSRAAYAACMKNNWHLEEIDKLKVKLVRTWTKEKCLALAKNYQTRQEFAKNEKGAYLFALRRGWKDEICEHMKISFTFCTKEKCKEEAGKYKTRAEWSKKNGASYQFALKQGEEFLQSICTHMSIKGNAFKRMVYAYEFADKYVYVGLTLNEEKRQDEHLIDKRGSVARHISKTGLHPKYKKLENYILASKAQEQEQYYIDQYKAKGWKLLNKSKAGALGGNDTYWTKEKCQEVALQFNRRQDLRNDPSLGGLVNAARKRGWWDEICAHMTGGNRRWSKKNVIEAAKTCTYVGEFQKKYLGAYRAAKDGEYLDEVQSFLKRHF